jgi:hypothetical protein
MDIIKLPSGEEFKYSSYKDNIIQRVQGNGKVKYMTIYYGETEDLITYQYSRKEIWYYKKPKRQLYMVIKKQIEKRKQQLRLKNKYKKYSLSDRLPYKKMLKMYRDLTDACDKVVECAKKLFENLGYDLKKDTVSIQEVIDASRDFHWKWNFLFIEWFSDKEEEWANDDREEEAN